MSETVTARNEEIGTNIPEAHTIEKLDFDWSRKQGSFYDKKTTSCFTIVESDVTGNEIYEGAKVLLEFAGRIYDETRVLKYFSIQDHYISTRPQEKMRILIAIHEKDLENFSLKPRAETIYSKQYSWEQIDGIKGLLSSIIDKMGK